jgi:hypothetical protein
MKRNLTFTVLLFVFLFGSLAKVNSQGGFGVGIIIGEPTGLSLKSWLSGRSALDAGIAWSFVGPDAVHVHVDYLWHNFSLIHVSHGKLPLYLGLGGRVRAYHDDVYLGARVPLGIEYIFAENRLDAFLEVVPILNLIPGTDFDINAAIGIRYFFH